MKQVSNRILEFCAENAEHIPKAIQNGAGRIELCDNLAVGGTTPSYGVLKKAIEYGRQTDTAIATMIRPRGGNFEYSADEIEMMSDDIQMAKQLGTSGVVLGCLTKEKRIDRKQTSWLLALCEGMEVTFHMAFDEIEKERQKEELNWLMKQKVTRLLTHGGTAGGVLDHADWLNQLVNQADGRIELLVGGGVTYENVGQISQAIFVNQFHGTKIVSFSQ